MNQDEIIKLAKECGFRRMVRAVGGGYTGDVKASEFALEAFYRAAFNAGLEAGAKAAYVNSEDCCRTRASFAIRALKELK